MKGRNSDKLKLSEQGIVTEDALVAYLNKELSPEETLELEKLLAQDPFAQDALEGLKSSANSARVTTSLSSLNKRVRERTGLKERRALQIHWVTYAWAAVILGLLVGISFFMVNYLQHRETPLAKNEKDKATQPAPLQELKPMPSSAATITDTAVKHTVVDSTSTATTGAPAAGAAAGYLAGTGASTNLTTSGAAAVTTTNNGGTSPVTYNWTPKEENKPTQNADRRTADTAKMRKEKTVVAQKNESTGANTVTVTGDATTLHDEGMKSFNSGDYVKASANFDALLKNDPGNTDALYFGGICDYLNGKTAKSEANFDKLLKGGTYYTEGSKWYKANILLKKGKSEAAKSLLKELSNGNSQYKERALKKLSEMGE